MNRTRCRVSAAALTSFIVFIVDLFSGTRFHAGQGYSNRVFAKLENGSLLLQDNQLSSREQIRDFMRAGFQGGLKGAHVYGWPLEVKFLAPNIAIAITEGGIIRAGESEIAPENQIRAVWTIVRNEDGELNLFSHQSSPIKG